MFHRGLVAALVFASGLSVSQGQAPGVPIEDQRPLSRDEDILAQAARLKESGALLSDENVAAQLASPKGGKVELVDAVTKPLSGRELAARARQAYLRVGWYYRCTKCEKWHLDAAGGYAIAKDVIVTCHHMLTPKAEVREGFLIVLDPQDRVWPVEAVIAKSERMDSVLLRVKADSLTPLALQENVAPGDKVSCFSEPLGQQGYFSTGIVNRFFWKGDRAGEKGSFEELESLRVNVSTDWAPGSSGAAVLDEFGNAIGHVSTVAPLTPSGQAPISREPAPVKDALAVGDEKAEKKTAPKSETVVITLHEAIPARSARALVEQAGANVR